MSGVGAWQRAGSRGTDPVLTGACSNPLRSLHLLLILYRHVPRSLHVFIYTFSRFLFPPSSISSLLYPLLFPLKLFTFFILFPISVFLFFHFTYRSHFPPHYPPHFLSPLHLFPSSLTTHTISLPSLPSHPSFPPLLLVSLFHWMFVFLSLSIFFLFSLFDHSALRGLSPLLTNSSPLLSSL